MSAEMGELTGKMSGSVSPGAISRVRDAIHALNEALEALWDPDMEPLSLEATVELWQVVKNGGQVIRDHENTLEDWVVTLMPDKVTETNLGMLEYHTSAKHTWDAPLLVYRIAQEAINYPRADEDGVEMPHAELIAEALLNCCSFSYFRLGKLDELGIDGKKYRESEWGRKRVKITPTPPSPPEDPGVA